MEALNELGDPFLDPRDPNYNPYAAPPSYAQKQQSSSTLYYGGHGGADSISTSNTNRYAVPDDYNPYAVTAGSVG